MKSTFAKTTVLFIAICSIITASKAQVTINLAATANWTPTGVFKNDGNSIFVCASGLATVWPTVTGAPPCPWASPSGRATGNAGCGTCLCTSCPTVSLIGRIGNTGTPFFIGDQAVLGAGVAAGELQIRVNDNPLNYGDNSGSFTVSVSNQCQNCSSGATTGREFGERNAENDEEVMFASASISITNPAKEELNVRLSLNEESQVALNLYSMDGRLLISIPESTYSAGHNEIKRKLEGIAGFYVVQVIVNGEMQTKKLIVNK